MDESMDAPGDRRPFFAETLFFPSNYLKVKGVRGKVVYCSLFFIPVCMFFVSDDRFRAARVHI